MSGKVSAPVRVKLRGIATRFKVSPVQFFVITALVFGVLFIIITPPFQTPDETVHFLRAYQVSEFNFVLDEQGPVGGGNLPKSLGDTMVDVMTHPNIQYNPNVKYNIYKTFGEFSRSTEPADTRFYDFSSTNYYTPLPYIAQAIGIGVARLLGLAPVFMMYMGRAMNLALWLVLFGLSIALMPRKKWALVAVGLLPMAIFQAISLSADVMAIGLAALMLAFVLRLREQKAVATNKQLLLLLSLAVGLAISKQAMFLFLPLILLVLNATLGKRPLLKKVLALTIPLLVLGAWMYIVKDIGSISNPINHQNPVQQTQFILHNPHSYINDLWNTYFYNWSDSIVASFIGIFGWQDAPLSELLVVVGYLSLAFLLFASYDGQKQWLQRNQKILLWGIAVAYWLAVSTALYVYYTPVGYKIIVGLQGRYFLPLALLAIPLFYGDWLKTTKAVYRRIAIAAPLILLLSSTITLYVRYYVNNV